MENGTLPEMTPPRENAGESVDWDAPVGYAHAARILSLLERP